MPVDRDEKERLLRPVVRAGAGGLLLSFSAVKSCVALGSRHRRGSRPNKRDARERS